MNEFETVQTWLRNTYNIGVSSEWLIACLEWLQQERQGRLPSMNDLTSLVYEQWLLSDLAEIGEPVLPPDIASFDKFELVSNYPLQLLSLVNVGFPLYGQKQKLEGRINPNEEVSADKPFQPAWEPKPSRMLLLQLTDGHTQIQAMEYQQIRDLHSELPSGLKLLVCGRVLCRRGMIMLTPECVQVLGGEVEALLAQNTPLTNIENAMIKNREDEGKHASKELSGKFISRGTDKKMDSLQKPFIKPHSYNKLDNSQQTSKLTSLHVKQETHEQFSSSSGLLNLKQETTQKKQESEQWNDDINYDDCFNDELDLEEIDALDFTSATVMEGDTPDNKNVNNFLHKSDAASFADPLKREIASNSFLKLQNVGDTNRIFGKGCRQSLQQQSSMNQNMMSSLNNKTEQLRNFPDVQEDDILFIDDDFEITEISGNGAHLNQGRAVFETVSSGEICIETDKSTGCNSSHDPKFMSKLSSKDVNNKMFISSSFCEPNNSTHNSGKRNSPSTLYQAIQPGKVQIKTKSSLSTPYPAPSHGVQSAPAIRNKLSRTKTGSQESAENSSNSKGALAKKQCKLSDMFRSNSSRNTTKQAPFDDDCTVIDSDSVPQSRLVSFNENSTHQSSALATCFSNSSKLVNMSSVSAFKSSSSTPTAASDCNIMTRGYPDNKMEWEQGGKDIQNNLLKAVIHPFPTSLDHGASREITGNLPFQYLSNLAQMQPPSSITVKAYISTLIDKLGSNGGEYWSLSCRINDGTACVDVDLADCVLAELIGFSAQDSVNMRNKMKTEPRVKDILMEGLTKCQQKLINISCLMKVDAVSKTTRPVITRLIPLSLQHVSQLIERISRQASA